VKDDRFPLRRGAVQNKDTGACWRPRFTPITGRRRSRSIACRVVSETPPPRPSSVRAERCRRGYNPTNHRPPGGRFMFKSGPRCRPKSLDEGPNPSSGVRLAISAGNGVRARPACTPFLLYLSFFPPPNAERAVLPRPSVGHHTLFDLPDHAAELRSSDGPKRPAVFSLSARIRVSFLLPVGRPSSALAGTDRRHTPRLPGHPRSSHLFREARPESPAQRMSRGIIERSPRLFTWIRGPPKEKRSQEKNPSVTRNSAGFRRAGPS